MIKVLLKKQMMEQFSAVFYNSKTGKQRSKSSLLCFAVLYLYVLGFFGFFFYTTAAEMAPMLQTPFAWLYMTLMSFIALTVGVMISCFMGYSGLYQAKDNDLLLSMPIPVSAILTTRVLSIYLIGLFFELLAMVPTLIVYFQYAEWTFASAVFSVLIPFVLSLFVLTLACALGYLIALISSKLKHKNVVTVVLAVAFLGGYFYVYSTAFSALQSIMMHVEALGSAMKWVYPMYQLGLASTGDAKAMLIGSAIFVALFALTMFVLAHNFIKLATSNKGAPRAEYREKRAKNAGVGNALLRKELYRFVKTPAYMLNCGLGTLFIVLAAVLMPIKGGTLIEAFQVMLDGKSELLLVLVTAAICGVTSVNDITAPSVSLEGKSLWIVQMLPVRGFDVLMAKLKLHLLFTAIPTILLCASVLLVMMPAWYYWVLIPVIALLYVFAMAMFGLFLNLKMPNFSWQNETAVVKQSMSVMLSMLLNMAIAVLIGVLYYALGARIDAVWYLAGVALLLAAASVALFAWLKHRGGKIFEEF